MTKAIYDKEYTNPNNRVGNQLPTLRKNLLMQQDRWITLAHGNGGRFMRDLIDTVFARHLSNPDLDVQADAVALALTGDIMFTTDGFTVQPLEFPGGDIGKLAVHGTANDLAVSGATPRYLSLSAIIEEGLEISQLDRIVTSLAEAAREAQVRIVAGDTKVVPHGQGGGLYFTTTGVGIRATKRELGLQCVQSGDRILVSGPVGDHGVSVMLAREEFGLHGDLRSDCACVLPLTGALCDLAGLRFMRDPTRGGLATVAYEISRARGLTVRLFETAIPVRDQVRSVCDMLGYDPYYLACEGRVVAVLEETAAATALARWRALPEGETAAIIGYVETAPSPGVILETELGGQRFLEELEDDPLPRIC